MRVEDQAVGQVDEAFVRQLEEAQSRLYSYIHMLVQNVADADDLFQQTTVIAWKKYAQFNGTSSFLTWVCGIARLEAKNLLRKRNKLLPLGENIDCLLVEAFEEFPREERDDRRTALFDCVRRLRRPDQRLLEECYVKNRRVRSIAEEMQRSPQSVHNSLYRIRTCLLECIQRTLARTSL